MVDLVTQMQRQAYKESGEAEETWTVDHRPQGKPASSPGVTHTATDTLALTAAAGQLVHAAVPLHQHRESARPCPLETASLDVKFYALLDYKKKSKLKKQIYLKCLKLTLHVC